MIKIIDNKLDKSIAVISSVYKQTTLSQFKRYIKSIESQKGVTYYLFRNRWTLNKDLSDCIKNIKIIHKKNNYKKSKKSWIPFTYNRLISCS